MRHRRGTPQHPDYDPGWRGPNGRRQCRRCLREVPKGRRTFCSDGCVRDFQLETGSSNWVRLHVAVRDHGVCAACGLDTNRLDRIASLLGRWIAARLDEDGKQALLGRLVDAGMGWIHRTASGPEGRLVSFTAPRILARWWILIRFGWSARQASKNQTLWEADHIVPLVEGGGFLLDNLQTLCVPCHTGDTARLAARRAASAPEVR